MWWSSIFRISMRPVERYRDGNASLAGDACHIDPPTDGQGMNIGLQDTYNLASKLVLVAKGDAVRRPRAKRCARAGDYER